MPPKKGRAKTGATKQSNKRRKTIDDPVHPVSRIAGLLLPPELPLPPLQTVAAVAAIKVHRPQRPHAPGPYLAEIARLEREAAELSAAVDAHNARCAAAWAPLAAMRAVCKDWCAAVTQALRCPPGWLPPDKALAPPGRWRGAPLTTLCIAVPFDQLAQEPDLDAWQADVRQQLQRLYPSLQAVRWQVLDLQAHLGTRLDLVLPDGHLKWRLPDGAEDEEEDEDNPRPLPRLVADSVVCPEREVTVRGYLPGQQLLLQGPLTLTRLVDALRAGCVDEEGEEDGGFSDDGYGAYEDDDDDERRGGGGRGGRDGGNTIDLSGHIFFEGLRSEGRGVYALDLGS